MRPTTACLLAVLVVSSIVVAEKPAAPARKPASKPASRPYEGPPLITGVTFPKKPGTKLPAAIVLPPASGRSQTFISQWRTALLKRDICVFPASAPEGGWQARHAAPLLKNFDDFVSAGNKGGAWAKVTTVDGSRVVLVACPEAGPAVMKLADEHAQRIAGVVMISVVPWVRDGADIVLWEPSEKAWKTPVWVAAGTVGKDAGAILLWRRIAANAPKGASLTIDPRIGAEAGKVEPDPAIDKWLAALAAGRKPEVGPDAQVVAETKRYQAAVGKLLDAMKKTPPADKGTHFSKGDGPMRISVTAPAAWQRVQRGERKYEAVQMPYEQIYLTPKPGSLLFARANAARWAGSADGLLDSYETRMRRAGFLTVRFKQWKTRGFAMQISSVLWPTRGKWHRWLMLVGAGPGAKNAPAAPLVTVMDASEKPDAASMAAAMKRILESTRAQWVAKPPGAAKAPDKR